MLYNIYSGYGVEQIHQSEIVYLCIPLLDVASDEIEWCFTDGNAAKRITSYYNGLNDINSLDWHSITTVDFKHDNADGDQDRIRKKHSEFLVRDYVPSDRVKGIVVYNQNAKMTVKAILQRIGSDVEVKINRGFYF